jgi:L,D-peptidoglycan transpeptidase YkuD (ErfK/YbiS/YcfS/YnhG family)
MVKNAARLMRRAAAGLVVLLLVVLGICWIYHHWVMQTEPAIPTLLAPAIPAECRQVMLVLSPNQESDQARLWLLERDDVRDDWDAAAGPLPVTLGHRGLAWGVGEHAAAPPPGFPIKREGDKCSPAGVFRIPSAFGQAAKDEAGWIKLPYTALTPSIVGVDDPKSRHYNQIVDNSQVTPDWDSNEPMSRHGELYRWGAFIAHNPQGVPGLGSCIFLHVWPGPGRGTSGCTAMSREDLEIVLHWLDPKLEPRLVQGLEGW